MKRVTSLVLALVLAVALAVPVYAAAPQYTLAIQTDKTKVDIGDTITVTLTMTENGAESFDLYSMQDYICFDPSYLTYVADSIQVYTVQSGSQSRAVLSASPLKFYATGDGDYNRIFINRASRSAETVSAGVTLLTFQLKAVAAGTASITHDGEEVFQTSGNLYETTLESASVSIGQATISGDNNASGGGSASGGSTSGGDSSASGGGSSSAGGGAASGGGSSSVGGGAASGGGTSSSGGGTTTTDKVTISNSTTNASGSVTSVDAVISSSVKNGESVTIPVEVTATKTTETAPVVSITMPASTTKVRVDIPVKEATPGTVAVLVKDDGTEEIVKKSAVTEDGIALTIEGDTTLKIIDNTRIFEDVAETYWADEAITFAAARSIFNGTSATKFSPETSMTRGMLAQVIYNLENAPEGAAKADFLDVSETSWCAEAISWAAENHIVTGYGNGKYAPNDSITREQLATMLWRYAGEPTPTQTSLDFTDADQVSSYAQQALLWANQMGIINGKGNGILDPKGLATRAQVAQMMMNFINAL